MQSSASVQYSVVLGKLYVDLTRLSCYLGPVESKATPGGISTGNETKYSINIQLTPPNALILSTQSPKFSNTTAMLNVEA